jgi:hypothetical protein
MLYSLNNVRCVHHLKKEKTHDSKGSRLHKCRLFGNFVAFYIFKTKVYITPIKPLADALKSIMEGIIIDAPDILLGTHPFTQCSNDFVAPTSIPTHFRKIFSLGFLAERFCGDEGLTVL